MIRFSEAARQIVERIRESLPEPLVMVIGSGCCEGPVPQLYPASGVPVKGVQVYEEDGLAVYLGNSSLDDHFPSVYFSSIKTA